LLSVLLLSWLSKVRLGFLKLPFVRTLHLPHFFNFNITQSIISALCLSLCLTYNEVDLSLPACVPACLRACVPAGIN
jgi:hypothetical protein